ncbi:MAG TPA: 1-acyl-sn-glycerol-3-phosphate acyltransferase [Bacteroidales bacterium]|nr:1-acyl-sn-glycerol-3-phosphate acyltransferase [Bacteroidales bacterium]
MKVLDEEYFEKLSPVFRGKNGRKRAQLFMRLTAIDKVNQVYYNSRNYTGSAFAFNLLKDIGVNYVIGYSERLKQLPGGAFITIANHPYGGLDGIILIDLIAGLRPDYKLMVNKVISLVKTMKENFISVTPTVSKKSGISGISLQGVREALINLQNGHPVGFFPSGAVSNFSLRNFKVRDRKWQTSIIHLIQHAKVPVLPIKFFDINSPFFYFLGMIHWKIRSLRLPSEVFNKRKQQPRIAIGNIISVQEQEKYRDIEDLNLFLRKAVYDIPSPASFIPRTSLELR